MSSRQCDDAMEKTSEIMVYLVVLLTSCVALSKSLPLPGLLLPHLKKKEIGAGNVAQMIEFA